MSIEALQKRIKTTEDLRGIVNTMKTLSSVSILQYEQANTTLKAYRENLKNAFWALVKIYGIPQIPAVRGNQRYLLVLFGSDSGMVGKFNKEILSNVYEWLRAKKLKRNDVMLITVGKRITMLAEQEKFKIFAKYASANSAKAVGSIAEAVIIKIEQAINKHHINNVVLWYHKRSKQSVELMKRKILPFNTDSLVRLKDKKWPTNNVPQITVKPEKLFSALVDQSLIISVVTMLNYSLAAEHFLRMTNMQNAEKNIDDNLEELNLTFQQMRQEQITGELIDVVAGYQAV